MPVTAPLDSRNNFRALLRRLWAAIVHYKGMVVAMLAFGFLETLFTKVPFVLVKPLMEELAAPNGSQGALPPVWLSPRQPTEVDLLERLSTEFNEGFRSFAQDVVASLGVGFAHPGMNVVLVCGVIAVLCGLLGSVTIYFVQTISRFFAIRIVSDLRCELANHFVALPVRFFGKQRMGEMISKVTNDTQVMQRSFELAADNLVLDPMNIAWNIGIVAWFVPQATWVLLLMVPVMVIPMYRQGRTISKRGSKSLQAMGETTESLNQILTGIRTVKAFQLEQTLVKGFEASTQTFLQRVHRMLRAKGRSMAQTFVSYQAGFGVLLVMLGYVVLVERTVRFSDVALVILPLATTYQHVKRLTRSFHVLMESAGALKGIDAILHEVVDQAAIGGKPLATVHGDIEMRDVSFRYDEVPVLCGLNLHVKAGQTVALVGESGGGKSTAMDLMQRLHDPQQGAILVDGHDLRDVRLADYRAHTAVVDQQTFLFNTSVRENIAYGKPGATQAQIEAAARAANIHDFIVTLPAGYDTVVGERGSNLSGGQRQRLTIARAIVRDPAVLFLDEGTSALDSENEEIVQAAIQRLRRGRTSIVVAHRLSTIVDADLIIVLDEGRVAESGTHAELIAKNGLYRGMYERQSRRSAASSGA